MNTTDRVRLVNLLLGERSLFKHIEDKEEITHVKVEIESDHAVYTWAYQGTGLPGKSYRRYDIDTPVDCLTMLAMNSILFDDASGNKDHYTTSDNQK